MKRLNRIATVLVVAVVTLMLVACSSSVVAGTVTGRQFIKEHSERHTRCTSIRPMICTPRTTHYDDEWQVQLTIKGEGGEPVSSWVEVSEQQYETLEEGDYFNSKPDTPVNTQ
jgi:hypothetical protein